MQIEDAMKHVKVPQASMSVWEKAAIDLWPNDEQKKMVAMAALHSMGNATRVLRSLGMNFKIELMDASVPERMKPPSPTSVSAGRRYFKKG